MIQKPEELMGSFYLGAEYDIKEKAYNSDIVNYDARDLTTHAVCVGMTGSGKTGLCIGLLEEAAMDKVPAIIIDPKGDMTNLLLQFEDLKPEDFKPWINIDDASRKGMSTDEYAAKMADTWKNGLASWGQGPERIKALKNSVDYTIFTPGSNSGIPINIMGSFAAPGLDFDAHAEMLHERIQGTVAALLGMIKNNEDPVRSREGILLSTLFEHYWRANEDLDLAKLIRGIQNPPVRKLGVFDVDTFFPEKDRFDLAMDFNTLIASPQFQYWLQGEPLDIDKIYYTAEGKPRHSIFYIAHLSDTERMFFVTLLLNSVIAWMRKQSGTTSLRSLVYFDEVFGYFPPTANPPSKKPLLTLLKQARAFGVGCVLVTQNPVDIDYKGLSNAGTWFIGKLQTERDKARVLEGLENAISQAGKSEKIDFDNLISALDSRVFLMHNVHEDEPVLYHTRWAMSYLRGPMTRPQVKELMKDKKSGSSVSSLTQLHTETSKASTPTAASTTSMGNKLPPTLSSEINQRFMPVWLSGVAAQKNLQGDQISLEYRPMIAAEGGVRFYDGRRNIDAVRKFSFITKGTDEFGRVDWDTRQEIQDLTSKMLERGDHPQEVSVHYLDVPVSMSESKDWKNIEQSLEDYLYHNEKLVLLEHDDLDLIQDENESPEAFQARIQQAIREQRDKEIDELEDKFEDKLDTLEERLSRELRQLETAEAEQSSRKTDEWVNAAETLFSIFAKGRRKSLGTVSTKRRMARKAAEKVAEQREDVKEMEEDIKEMEREMQEALNEVRKEWEEKLSEVQHRDITPRKSDIQINVLSLVWVPYWVDGRGGEVLASG